MKKEVLIKAKTEEVIADFLRPIIREEADKMLEKYPSQYNFYKNNKSLIGVTVNLNDKECPVYINFRGTNYDKTEIISILYEKDWIKVFKENITKEKFVELVYNKIVFVMNNKKNIPKISFLEIEEYIEFVYNLDMNNKSNKIDDLPKIVTDFIKSEYIFSFVAKSVPNWYYSRLTNSAKLQIILYNSLYSSSAFRNKNKNPKNIYEYINYKKELKKIHEYIHCNIEKVYNFIENFEGTRK